MNKAIEYLLSPVIFLQVKLTTISTELANVYTPAYLYAIKYEVPSRRRRDNGLNTKTLLKVFVIYVHLSSNPVIRILR